MHRHHLFYAFQPLYFLMLLMCFEELKTEVDPLARVLDYSIIILGVVFMALQGLLMSTVGKPSKNQVLKKTVLVGLVIWFLVEVVLSYWWCFVTGHDPILEHTPFVIIFFGFNCAQYWVHKALGIFDSSQE